MIWEKEVHAIVMLAMLEEKGKVLSEGGREREGERERREGREEG